ncbi:hypothetical protein SDC9_200834 [bioreactor metagenome]|uniref:Uncharacterized protein n=1 Tax=bioreactor metagenome TaxID=1076179 RepID=A0A645IQ66_9ZZZZ
MPSERFLPNIPYVPDIKKKLVSMPPMAKAHMFDRKKLFKKFSLPKAIKIPKDSIALPAIIPFI